MEPVLSVIVNFYQSEDYVKTCIESLVRQTIQNIEIIAVDDGSSDKTVELLHTYSERYENVRIISQENRGLAFSRKIGLLTSQGQYITFVDGDDYVSSDIYRKMVELALAEELDIVQCNIIPCGDYDSWKEVEASRKYTTKILSGDEYLQLYLNREIMPALWQRIFRRSIVKPEQFKTVSRVMSDHFNFPEWASAAGRVCILPDQGYYWLTRKGSLGQPDNKIQASNAKNRFLSGISILGFSGVNAPENRVGVLRYLTSYLTQTAYHLRLSDIEDFQMIYSIWDHLKGPFNMMAGIRSLENDTLLYFFSLLEENRNLWQEYIIHDFLESQAGFINAFHYNGDDIFH